MNPLSAMSSRRVGAVRLKRSGSALVGLTISVCATILTLAACTARPPAGQVVATVDGKEVTNQDLMAEARASGAQGSQDPKQLLQHVIARVLLSQSAHDRKLDAYPGYPSDLLRIQQTFLAQKALQTVLKPPPTPSPSDVAAFVAAHPYSFANRMRIQLDEVRFHTSDNLKSIAGAVDLPSLVSRLKSLSTPFDQATRTLDTAQLPGEMADKIATGPIGQLIFVREGDVVLAMVVQARQPVVLSPDQQAAIATQLMSALATQRQVDAEVNQLRAKAKIVYQSGYSPAISAPAAAAAPVG